MRKARRMRRKERLLLEGNGVVIEVSRAVKLRWTRVRRVDRSFSVSIWTVCFILLARRSFP